jgi:hypothetical protein
VIYPVVRVFLGWQRVKTEEQDFPLLLFAGHIVWVPSTVITEFIAWETPTEDDQVGSPAVPGPVASYIITPEDANDVTSQRTRYLNTLDAVNEELWIMLPACFESSEAELIFANHPRRIETHYVRLSELDASMLEWRRGSLSGKALPSATLQTQHQFWS